MSQSTLTLHHAILTRALRKTVRNRMINANPAADLENRARRTRSKSADARQHYWSVSEAQRFLEAGTAAGPQPAAFYALALDSGMRKGELCGLGWQDVDVHTAKVRVVGQLISPKLDEAGQLVFGPTKTGRVRPITISAQTAELLGVHRAQQREDMMRSRPGYSDFDLVFARGDGRPSR